MQSYYDKARYLFKHLPGDRVKEYVLTTREGNTLIELVALKMMASDGKTGKNDETEEGSNSIYR
jgi:hypothetical protein